MTMKANTLCIALALLGASASALAATEAQAQTLANELSRAGANN